MENKIDIDDRVKHQYYGYGRVFHIVDGKAQVVFDRDFDPFNLTVVPLDSLMKDVLTSQDLIDLKESLGGES